MLLCGGELACVCSLLEARNRRVSILSAKAAKTAKTAKDLGGAVDVATSDVGALVGIRSPIVFRVARRGTAAVGIPGSYSNRLVSTVPLRLRMQTSSRSPSATSMRMRSTE